MTNKRSAYKVDLRNFISFYPFVDGYTTADINGQFVYWKKSRTSGKQPYSSDCPDNVMVSERHERWSMDYVKF